MSPGFIHLLLVSVTHNRESARNSRMSAPILAFKAVYSMERISRENDKRIISLYVAMKDMIAVIVQ